MLCSATQTENTDPSLGKRTNNPVKMSRRRKRSFPKEAQRGSQHRKRGPATATRTGARDKRYHPGLGRIRDTGRRERSQEALGVYDAPSLRQTVWLAVSYTVKYTLSIRSSLSAARCLPERNENICLPICLRQLYLQSPQTENNPNVRQLMRRDTARDSHTMKYYSAIKRKASQAQPGLSGASS